MAGYIFAISKDGWRQFCTENLCQGFFTPFCLEITENATDNQVKSAYKILSAVFGDMVTMKPNDNIYFLSDRKIYGIGKAVLIGDDCKYDNYTNASELKPNHLVTQTDYLTTASTRARWVCFFEPDTYFFKRGVDMDDVLQYRPAAFKVLRAFEGLSFIKIDDEENRALKEFISLNNEFVYENGTNDDNVFSFDDSTHIRIRALADLPNYKMDIGKALLADPDRVLSEMFIESTLLQHLCEEQFTDIGKWDHLTHQLIASPFKPLKYIDKIDIFGYRFSDHYENEPKLITKYLIIELKKGNVNKAALEQAMQYVDWICSEYAAGDYSMIEAYVLGSGTVRDLNSIINDVCQRSFIKSTHPVVTEKWNDIHVIRYSVNNDVLSFEVEDETP